MVPANGEWGNIIMTRGKIVLITVLAGAFFFFASPALAQVQAPSGGGIKIGPLEFHPGIGLTETYSDNIYQSYDGLDSKTDYITTISPGVGLVLPLRRHSIQLGYRADIYKFADFKENDYTNHTAVGALNFDFPGGLLINISDTFQDLTTPRKWRRQSGLTGAADPYREKDHQTNDFKTMVKYRFVDRWAVEARYGTLQDEYDKDYDNWSDFTRDTVGGSIYYRFTPKTDIVIDYNFSDVDYDEYDEDDNENHAAYIGLSFDPTAKIQGYAKVGWAEKEYKKSSPRRDDDSASIFSTLIDLGYLMTPFDKISLTASRVILEDVDTNASYTNTEASLAWAHVFGWNEKVSMTTSFGYGTRDYDDSATDVDGTQKVRDDDRWIAGIGFGYAIQEWLNLGLNYSYTDNDSNFKRYDYYENRVLLNLTLQY